MKTWREKGKLLLNAMPACVVAVCMVISLSGYEPPVYEVRAAQDVAVEEETGTGDMAMDFDSMEVALPPTTTRSGPTSGASKNVKKTKDAAAYKDGIYYGTGTGFGGRIRVKVVIKSGKIVDIRVMESKDGESYMRAASALLKVIIKKQSTNVDAVSGATYSSVGLIEAVRDALKNAARTKKNSKKDKKDTNNTTEEKDDNTETEEKVTYTDGIYYGTGTGFGGTLKVKVVVSGGKITDIQIVESKDDQAYIKAASALLKNIIKKQSANVDTISGATYSSKGLIEAVKDALKKAISTTEDEDQTDTTEQTDADNNNTIPEGKVPYKDGVYYGTGEGYKGDITVAVTISDHTIRYILVTESADDEAFFSRAKAVLQTIMHQQNTDVDVVSGATYSSRGLIEAVQEALEAAKKATEGTDPNGDGAKEDTTKTDLVDDTTEQEPATGKEDTTEESGESSKLYKDGTYTMAVICDPDDDYDFEPYTLSVTITIKDDKVVSVTDIYQADGEEDNSYYVTKAAEGTRKHPGVVTQIQQNGNAAGIDAVSGATCSSRAIIEAVQSMLENAGNDYE